MSSNLCVSASVLCVSARTCLEDGFLAETQRTDAETQSGDGLDQESSP